MQHHTEVRLREVQQATDLFGVHLINLAERKHLGRSGRQLVETAR
jgi:hypothetical protein